MKNINIFINSTVLIAAAVFYATPSYADTTIYKCEQGNKIIYQEDKCSGSQKKIDKISVKNNVQAVSPGVRPLEKDMFILSHKRQIVIINKI